MVRVRIAPSPTGPDVHIGNVRTALFNYLFAKQHKESSFIFRIEDSDQARSKPEYADTISDSLNWLGLKADEGYNVGGDFGPYSQMKKLNRYKQFADQLIDTGKAYRCYCSADDLASQRKSLIEKNPKAQFKYPGTCRDLKNHLRKDYVVRFKSPTEGETILDDMVFGRIATPNIENQDFVLMRGNGIPLYNMGCVVDDLDQKITHVIRGRDHIINYVPQALLYDAVSAELPKFAHLPMMLGSDGAKLSKRHGSVSITEYRNKGYSPGGILNYLLRFGFGFGNQEIFSMQDMIDKFSFDHCGRNDGKFDEKKFAAIQCEHLKSESLTSSKDFATYTRPFLHDLGLNPPVNKLEKLIPLVRSRSKTFIEAANELDPILRKDISIDVVAMTKFITDETKPKLHGFFNVLSAVNNWTEEHIRASTQDWLKQSGLTIKDIGQPARIAIVGRTNSPELFQVMAALGKEITLSRLQPHIK